MDFSRYQPPGVYVEDQTTPVTSRGSAVPSLLVLVGSSRGHREHTEQIALDGVDPVTLNNDGIDLTTVEVTGADGTVHVEDTDYTIAQTGTGAATTTTITRIDAAGIADGDTVFVAYQYTDADYVALNRFASLDSVEAYYGPAINFDTDGILSPLTLAAQIAFANGADEVGCLDVGAADPQAVTTPEINSAYSKLTNEEDVSIVVPLPTGVADGDATTVGTDLETHVQSASNDILYRTGIVGFDTGVTTDPATLAASIASQRVMLAYPNRLDYYNGQLGKTFEVGGQYLAAAYGGQIIGQAVSEPLTKNLIRGFAGIPAGVLSTMTRSNKNAWSQGGVSVTEQSRGGRLTVRHGVTTDPSNSLTRELSLVRAKDAMVFALKDSMDRSGLVGSAIQQDTVLSVKAMAASSLESSMQAGVFVSYTNLRVRQTGGDPSVIEIKFQYQPAYPLNYIVISFSLDISNGEIEEGQFAA